MHVLTCHLASPKLFRNNYLALLFSMKKVFLLALSFYLISSVSFGQTSASTKEKIANYIRSQTEVECRKLLDNNGFKSLQFMKGYPSCLDGYVFYSDRRTLGEESEVLPEPAKCMSIEGGSLKVLGMGDGYSCEIVFTLTAKNNLDSDCFVFIGTNGWLYSFNLFKFERAVPMTLDFYGLSFLDFTLKRRINFLLTGNSKFENNESYNFSGFANSLKCANVYESVGSYYEGLAWVKKNGKFGIIDEAGGEVVPPLYDNAIFFQEGMAQVKYMDKWGFIDKSGKEVIPVKYESAGAFSEGLANVRLNGKWGFIDKSGNIVIPIMYDNASRFSEGKASVRTGDKETYIDKTGKAIMSTQYDVTLNYYEGFAGVAKGDLWGFIDKTGAEVIPLKYEKVDSFSEGLAGVKSGGKWGFIDTGGNVVLPIKYDYVGIFLDGIARVSLEKRVINIDKTGKEK